MAQVDWGGDIQKFFNNDLKCMFANMFKHPTSCISRLDSKCQVKSIVSPIMMVAISFVVIILMSLIFTAIQGISSYVNFGFHIKTALLPVFFCLFYTLFVFVAMAIKSPADIAVAFNNSAIHVLNLTLAFIVVYLVVSIFGGNIMSMKGSTFMLIIETLILIYSMSIGIGNVRQTLTNANCGESYSWWIAPLVVVIPLALSIWIVTKLY